MKKLYLFRHGETDWNKNKQQKYSEEVHNVWLNDLGVEQAKKNAENLKDKNIQIIYTSPLKRALQTAQILSDTIGVDIKIVDDLQEYSIYDDSVIGLNRKEIKEKIGVEKYAKYIEERDALLDWRPLKCETKREARNRIFNAIVNICKSEKSDIIGISSHGAILRELLRMLNFEDDSKIANCEVIEAEFDGNKLKIIRRVKDEN